ncbi:MAG: hypothetical protein ACOC2R_03125 [Spirochaetota bacterium]
MNWFRRFRFRSKRSSFAGNLEYLGEDFLNRVTQAARKETWGRTVIQLAWTAGPVTYLALQGGYLLGYGQSAPSNLFIYFAIYTIIAGVFAILMRFLYQVTRGQELEKAEVALKYALARLPDLILYTRNQVLRFYDADNRRILAAKYLLENPDASTETVKTAVKDVSNDEVLAQTAQRIEIFRKNGLFVRIEDERNAVETRLEQAIEQLAFSSSTVADLLRLRFEGRPPSRSGGRVRTEGFIGRTLSAGEEHEFNTMTLNDAEEIFTLAYELLAGRTIPVFSLRYIGSKEFTDVSENFDRARLAFRKAAYVRNSKLRTLAELFAESEPVDIVPAAAPVFTTVDRMYANILKALDQLYKELKRRTSSIPFQRRRRNNDTELQEKFEQLHTAIDLHRSLRAANNQLNKRYAALRRAERRYNEVKSKTAKQFPLHLLKPKERKRGIKIVEKHIELSKSSKMRCARDAQKLIDSFFNSSSQAADEYKQLAIDIAIKLEHELKISRFELQYAIESSNAPYLSTLEMDMTAATKAGLAVSLVRELQKNMCTPIHRLAHVLVNYHGMPLSQESIEFLVQRYGADPERLSELLPEHEESAETGTAQQPSHLIEISRLERKYQDLLDSAVRRNII